MSKKHRAQLDLLEWEPPPVVPAFPDGLIRAANFRDRMSRAVAETLKASDLSREEIARRMGEFLGEPVSADSINVYASQARTDQTISALRLMALAHATGDVRAMQLLAEPLGYSMVPNRYLPAIKAEMLGDKIEQLQAERETARRQWKGPRR